MPRERRKERHIMESFTSLVVASAVLIPIATGIVQIVKGFEVNSFYAPVVSLFVGIALEFLAVGTVVDSPSIRITILLGLIVGLSASGLYSGVGRMTRAETANSNQDTPQI